MDDLRYVRLLILKCDNANDDTDYFKIFMGLPTTGGPSPPPQEQAKDKIKGAVDELKNKI